MVPYNLRELHLFSESVRGCIQCKILFYLLDNKFSYKSQNTLAVLDQHGGGGAEGIKRQGELFRTHACTCTQLCPGLSAVTMFTLMSF